MNTKRLFFFLLASAGALLTSCSQDESPMSTAQPFKMSLSAALPNDLRSLYYEVNTDPSDPTRTKVRVLLEPKDTVPMELYMYRNSNNELLWAALADWVVSDDGRSLEYTNQEFKNNTWIYSGDLVEAIKSGARIEVTAPLDDSHTDPGLPRSIPGYYIMTAKKGTPSKAPSGSLYMTCPISWDPEHNRAHNWGQSAKFVPSGALIRFSIKNATASDVQVSGFRLIGIYSSSVAVERGGTLTSEANIVNPPMHTFDLTVPAGTTSDTQVLVWLGSNYIGGGSSLQLTNGSFSLQLPAPYKTQVNLQNPGIVPQMGKTYHTTLVITQ